MIVARWNGTVIAESDRTEAVEGNHYFPPADVKKQYLLQSDHKTVCPWKGEATYKHLSVDGEVNANAAFTYLEPKDAAKQIQGYYAFWHGVEVTEE